MAAKLGLVLVVACTLYVQTYAQANCAPALTGLVPCLPYITGNSSTPVPMCCTQLSAVVQSQPQCLCLVLGSNAGSTLGISVNQTQALALPSACNVKTPSPTLCSALAGAPTGSPAPATAPPATGSAPAASPAGTPPASTPGATTKPAAASPGPSASGSSMNSASSLVAVAAIFIVSCASALGVF
ncbi:non-specific lipid transfer protein GPI-anchored 19-like isoform X2 [Nymphaea colorata]|uniref:non-specific lipid transfer protein GPI-anchored 19-like isoform X2 n=1 Tax=Nymphaea colorata TaxID=210225 RepID=UPI00129D8D55|nr:non-specific lipid transfer protein GPI-anchored 19-like isoform X2 [Nymphaea colorata]